MMNNLFSVFDPCTGMLSLNWLSTIIFLMLMPYKMWMTENKISFMMQTTVKILNKEMLMLMKYKGTNLIMISLFMMLLFNNLMGLTPYVYTSSAQLTFSLTMALPLWTALMMYGWINKTNSMFSHLVPNGTPGILMPFMVMIETISNIIRPGSLAVRLTANMIAGHLLMTLLGNNKSMTILISTMIIFMTLLMFEIAVAIIQSYVFMTLMTLYSSEI
uniref:ATP synthase subunit a n=1 Tax=Paraahimia luodianensis TaxID=2726724 RepID=A0A6H1XKZ5_9HEMI|nr:ATP synthase F0 subunit 6 [Paraahimia luodianensis]QJA16298.1 ATP synthase F0 subunit 6 [Paraahimia luodianensis]